MNTPLSDDLVKICEQHFPIATVKAELEGDIPKSKLMETIINHEVNKVIDRAVDQILSLIASKMPEKKPKVVKRKGFYPPYQPQVEQHERNGWNAYHDSVKSILKGREAMKITVNGEDYELTEAGKYIFVNASSVLMEPVKKTEEKSYCLYFDLNLDDQDMQNGLVWKELDLTPTTANKLSEAISALVEYVQLGKFDSAMFVGLDDKIEEARESFQESQ